MFYWTFFRFLTISSLKLNYGFFRFSNYRIHFLDNYYDVSNYDQPVAPFVHETVGGVSPSTSSSSYINFNNVQLTTHDGLIFDEPHTIESFQFQDRVEIVNKYDPNSIMEGNIFMMRLEGQNTPTYYERTYIRLQEVLASIGGMVKALFMMARFVNIIFTFLWTKPLMLKKIFSTFITSESLHAYKSNLESKKSLQSPRKIKLTEEESNSKDMSQSKDLFTSAIDNHMKNDNGFVKPIPVTTFKRSKSFMSKARTKMLNLEVFNNSVNIKNKIFNEFSIYKIYFELEKLKRILFSKEQSTAFTRIKLDINSLLQDEPSNAKLRNRDLIDKLKKDDEKISQRIGDMLKES